MDTFSSERTDRRDARFEQTVLLLQGGGALGSYQAGVYQALAEANLSQTSRSAPSIRL